ncbi:MAG: DUF4405 domain-containing protein [Spirochaetes bacterium]|nr:DUF4405 domain-containing protein [Spirochaetota bacterium]
MRKLNNAFDSVKLNFYLNLLNFLPFVILTVSGMIIQIEYHIHELPDAYVVSGLNRSGWLLIHKISSVISFAGIVLHCIMHRKYIVTVTKKILNRKNKPKILLSYYLLIIYIPASLICLFTWIFLNHEDTLRHTLIEVHDKLTILLIIFTAMHLIQRAGWMVRTIKKLFITRISGDIHEKTAD